MEPSFIARRDNYRPGYFKQRRAQPMAMRVKIFPGMICVVTFSLTSLAQTPERRQTIPTPQTQEQTSNLPPDTNINTVAIEIGLLRQSLQTLNARLRTISEKLLVSDPKQGDPLNLQQNRISLGLELLSRAEQRAEALRKQLLELIEKETALKSRLVQIEEDIRPESLERATSLAGSTRTPELRDVRRRVLDNERKGYDSLLKQISESRIRLEDDLRQADALVFRLRQRVLPLIEKEIEKIKPN
jgi:hypothetical protein